LSPQLKDDQVELIPAIDIKDGKCVRLFQGDYEQVTVFSDDPVEMAVRWESEGSECLHIVDLDGAKTGATSNYEVVERICRATDARIQLGGGIRSLSVAKTYSEVGVDRLILGTMAVDFPDELIAIMDSLGPESVIVSVDARSGVVALDGWTRITKIEASELVSDMSSKGVVRCMYTDIERDGTLSTPNFDAIGNLVGMSKINVIAAGGISTLDSLLSLAELGVEGAIVGRAIYTGHLDLKTALNAIEKIQ